MNILTDEEVIELCCKRLSWTDDELIRAIEAEVVNKLRKQVIEEICFKMAAGSPNRERIHKLIDGWVQ